jgi:hypothetical protein
MHYALNDPESANVTAFDPFDVLMRVCQTLSCQEAF